jgi:biopolymer transport protein TolR
MARYKEEVPMTLHASGAGIRTEINVTPLVDVVLVLLIIFMVVTPLAQMGYGLQVPAVGPPGPTLPAQQLIVRMERDGGLFINQEEVPKSGFEARLREILDSRTDQAVFLMADGELSYEKVAEIIDLCGAGGAPSMAIVYQDPAPST